MIYYGVDISHHQTNAVVKEVVNGGKASFVITRPTIGTGTLDKKIDIFMADIIALAIKNSHYQAAYAGTKAEAVQEANFICDTIEKYLDKVEMPIFYDWEYFSDTYNKGRGIYADKALIQAMTVAFCEQIKNRGYKAGFYANKDFCDRFYTVEFFAAHPDYYFWYARPGLSKPDRDCYLWQYGSDNGIDYGYSGGNLDKNILFGEFVGELPPSEVMQPLFDGLCRMKIGFASDGDIKKLNTKINGLGIATEVTDGYIITGQASKGDQCYIMVDCNALGVPYEIYTEPPQAQEPQPEVPAEDTPVTDVPKEPTVTPPKEEFTETDEPLEDIPQEKPAENGSLFIRILKRIFAIFFGGE